MANEWPNVVDDDGDGLTGTIYNKALTDAMKAYIDAADGVGGAVDWSAAAVAVAIKDNEAAAVNFLEGSNSYLKLITTNDAEAVALGQKVTIVDDSTATYDLLTLTPGGAMAAETTWRGIYINGAALDPSGVDVTLEGIEVNLSGVATTNSPEMRAGYLAVPAGLGYEALHAIGKIKLDNDESGLAAGESATGVDIIIAAVGASGGEYHAIDVASAGASSASLTALATHTGIDVIHQHTGTFIVPTKAWKYDDSGASYTDVTTAFGSAGTDVTMFEDDDDAIFIGADAAFDEIEVILATPASISIKPTFWYSKAATFTQFFPADDTEGFTQDGDIRFDADDLADFVAQSVNGTSKFYIKIVRTRNNIVTEPIEDTIKTLGATENYWNSSGILRINGLTVTRAAAAITGEEHLLSVDYSGICSSGDSMVGGNFAVTPTGSGATWVSGIFAKVTQGTTKAVSGYFSGAEFECNVGAMSSKLSDFGVLVLNWNSAATSSISNVTHGAYLLLRDYGSQAIASLMSFVDASMGTKSNASIVTTIGDTGATHAVRFQIGTTYYWLLAMSTLPSTT